MKWDQKSKLQKIKTFAALGELFGKGTENEREMESVCKRDREVKSETPPGENPSGYIKRKGERNTKA